MNGLAIAMAEEDRSVRIYPPSAKRTNGQGEATFTIHSDHSVELVATARNQGGKAREELHLEIHTVPSIRIEPAHDGAAGKYRQETIGLSLFDMENDPYETTNVLEKHPQIAKKLQRLAEQHRERFYSKQNAG